jgi:hypothetical protein
MSTITKQIRTNQTLKLRGGQNIEFQAVDNVVLPSNTDFSACAVAINAEVDLSSKQDVHAHLSEISALSGAEGQVLKFNNAGEIVAGTDNEGATALTFNAPLSESGGEVSLDDTGFLKSADLGVTVQAYDSSLLNSSHIGSTVQAYSADILTNSSIGDSVQAKNEHLDEFIALHGVAWNHAIPYYNETNGAFELTDSNQIQDWGNMQEGHASLTQLSNATPASGDVLRYDGSAWVADSVSIDDSNYAKLDAVGNAFEGVIQQQLIGSSSYSYTKVFDATSSNTTEFSLASIPVDPTQMHHVVCDVVAFGHNGASTIRKLTCNLSNSNGTLNQSNEYGDEGLFPIALGKCEFDVSSNFLLVRVQGVADLNTRYHARLTIMSVAPISA